jgi:hypothetical protein
LVTEFQPQHAIHFFGPAGQYDDRDVVLREQALRQHQPVLVGEIEVQDDEVHRIASQGALPLGAG